MKFIPLALSLGLFSILGCAGPGTAQSSTSSSDDDSASFVDNSPPVSVTDNSNVGADAIAQANSMAATQAANDAAQAQNNAAQADAIQTMVNANNSPPPQ